MSLSCQHCGTHYTEFTDHGGFCCSGCAQVYQLIQQEGMGGYYALQDRVGLPPVVNADSLTWANRLQRAVESESGPDQLTLAVYGMTCLGCAWLVEKITRSLPGVNSVRVELESNSVVIQWIRGEFKLSEMISEVRRFGYDVQLKGADSTSRTMSPLLWRSLLCGLFSVNGILLWLLPAMGIDLSQYDNLFNLLEYTMAGLGFLVGGTFFVSPVYQSLRMRRLHYDALPSVALLFGYGMAFMGDAEWWCMSSLLTLLLLARWVHRRQWRSSGLVATHVDVALLRWLQVCVGLALLCSMVLCIRFGVGVMVTLLLAIGFYPLARSASYGPSVCYMVLAMSLTIMGLGVAFMSGNSFIAVMWMLISGVMCNILFFRYPQWFRNFKV